MKRTSFEINYGLLSLGYSKHLDWGLFLRLHLSAWTRIFWAHPEADVIWYDIGPFAFYTTGRSN